jgi:multisubunit Na+/H+ antiporter MnhC subunit
MDPVGQVLVAGAIGLVVIGIAGIVLSNHLFRMILALAIAEAGANLLLVLAGYRWDAVAPILLAGEPLPAAMVDPVPQALVLTAIVIGVGVQALALSLVIRVREAYGTLDLRVVRARLEADLSRAAGVAPPGSQEQPAGERPLPAPARQLERPEPLEVRQ